MEPSIEDILKESQKILESANNLQKELEVEKDDVNFLTNEYKENKKYFRCEPGRTTIDDVIKTTYEFAWSQCKNFYKINQ